MPEYGCRIHLFCDFWSRPVIRRSVFDDIFGAFDEKLDDPVDRFLIVQGMEFFMGHADEADLFHVRPVGMITHPTRCNDGLDGPRWQ